MSGLTLVEMRGTTQSFCGVTSLSDVDLDAYAGEFLAIVGENGAGKSTLKKILTGDRGESASTG